MVAGVSSQEVTMFSAAPFLFPGFRSCSSAIALLVSAAVTACGASAAPFAEATTEPAPRVCRRTP
jgi:hypothetical protein